jgi:hypothetical protein
LETSSKKAEQDKVKVKTRMTSSFGSLSFEIISYAEKENVDPIVMGTRGRCKLKNMLLFSTASGVVMNAPCTVMVKIVHTRASRQTKLCLLTNSLAANFLSCKTGVAKTALLHN